MTRNPRPDRGLKKGPRGGHRNLQHRRRLQNHLASDERFLEQMRIAAEFGEDAVEDRRVSDPRVIDELEKGNELADTLPGRLDLKKRRRRWIPRNLEDGLPLFPPDVPPATSSCVYRLLVLEDELDFTIVRLSPATTEFPEGVPLGAYVSHAQFRALTGWKASLLDKKLHADPASLPRRIDDGVSGVKFDPVSTARWLQKRNDGDDSLTKK